MPGGPGQGTGVADFGLHLLGGSRASASDTTDYNPTTSRSKSFKGGLSRHQSRTEASLALWSQPLHRSTTAVVTAVPHSQLPGCLVVNSSQGYTNSNQGSTTTEGCTQPTQWWGGSTPGVPGSGDQGDWATGPYKTLTTESHSIKTRDVVALPNTQKQTQGSNQIEETKKHDPNDRIEKNLKKKI